MRGTLGTEVVTLDCACETLTDRGPGTSTIWPTAKRSTLMTSPAFRLDSCSGVTRNSFRTTGFYTGLGQMACERLSNRLARRLPKVT